MNRTKTFTLKVNYRASEIFYLRELTEQLTQQADLTLGKNKWYVTHFQALEKENGDMVFKMRVVFKEISHE